MVRADPNLVYDAPSEVKAQVISAAVSSIQYQYLSESEFIQCLSYFKIENLAMIRFFQLQTPDITDEDPQVQWEMKATIDYHI